MTIDKEIRAVALGQFHPDQEELEKILSDLKKNTPVVNVKYAEDNPKDPTCMEVMLGLDVLGYVNADDKRFIEPLLRDNGVCEAEFLEVYREEDSKPIVRFTVTVDLDDVKPLVAGEGWAKWSYSFPKLKMFEELRTAEYTGHLLKEWLQKKKELNYTTLEDLVDSFIHASLFDMSVETSAYYDDILFYLETSRKRNRTLINKLQRGCTSRRTDKIRGKFLKEWWPKFIMGDLSKRLCDEFINYIESCNDEVTDDAIMAEYRKLEQELRLLPNDLYIHIGNLNTFWATLYYTRVPRDKFLDVLSGVILRNKLKACLDDKQPFVVIKEDRCYYQIFSGGENNIYNQ